MCVCALNIIIENYRMSLLSSHSLSLVPGCTVMHMHTHTRYVTNVIGHIVYNRKESICLVVITVDFYRDKNVTYIVERG